MKRYLSLIVLAALLLGLLVGIGIRGAGDPAFLTWLGVPPADQSFWLDQVAPQLVSTANVIEPFGGLWLNALRMTVVPLVFALLVVGIASVTDAGATGRLAARAVVLFSVLLIIAATFGIAATQGMLALWPVSPEAAAGFVASAGESATEIAEPPTFAGWIAGLAPSNPVQAAAETAILPLVVFAVFFGFATTRLQPAQRDPIVNLFRAISEAMVVIVHWVLLAGPIGVFALAIGVGLRAGAGAAGTLIQYAVIVAAVTAASTVLAWLLAVTFGRQPIGRFTVAIAPVWAIAFSTQSSLASLPAMIESARQLKIPDRVIDLILPLAVAVFRFTSPVANLAVCFFVAHLYGIEPTILQIIGAVLVAYGVSIGSVGLPGQISFIASIAPISIALGVPTELLGILLAIEVIPDIFRTLGNTTADVAVTSILGKGQKELPAPETERGAVGA